MIRLVTRGRFTHAYVKALLGAPEDREPAVRKVIEAAGGKVISFYMTTGDTDFLLISETNEAEAVIAAHDVGFTAVFGENPLQGSDNAPHGFNLAV